MTLNPRTILILFAISLQGCGGGGKSPPPTPPPVSHLVSINIRQISPSTLYEGGKPVNELPGKEVVFKAYGHYDNTDKVPDITSKVTWISSDCNVICPTSTPGHYKTINPGEADVYAGMGRVNEDPAESNHITKNVPEPHPYKIVIRRLDEDKLVNDKIPKGLKVSYAADIYWDSGPVPVSDGTNDVTWQEDGDGFKQDNKQKNLFLASGEVGSDSTLTASYEGVSSDPRTLEVSNPILKKLHIEVDGGQSTSVPRGQDRTLKAEAEFEGIDGDVNVTKDVSWNSDKNPAFEQKDNTFRAIGSKDNVGKQTSITASLSDYPSEPSNQVILTISPAELVGVRTEIDKGANVQVPRYLTRTLKAIGVYKGDVSGVSGSDKTFEEDITSTVASWTSSDESSFVPIQGTSNRFQAVGKPGSTSVVTPELPNFKDAKGIKLSVSEGVITGLEIEHADDNKYNPGVSYSDNVPKKQTRMFRVMATFDSASGDSPKEDVTGDSELIISDDSFEKISNNTVEAVGKPGESAVVSANYSGQSTDNNFTLTVQKEQSDIIKIGSKIFTKPTKRMNYADAQEYCSNLGGTIPNTVDLDMLVQAYVGPNHGWPWYSAEGWGTYWSNEVYGNGNHMIVNLKDRHEYPLSDTITTNQVSCVIPAVGAMRQ